jgi:hypothetical protein
MAEQIKIFISGKLAAIEPTVQYGIVGQQGIIDKFTATNTGDAEATFSVYLVPQGQEAGVANAVVSNCTIAPGEACLCPELIGQVIGNGESIVTSASAEVISIRCSGRLL